ncbi:MAG: metallophosphoesterase [Firmicutes bacterium]|nr:metallophosphoesterase [Bacillota bacterium]
MSSLYAIADLHLATDPSIEDKSMDMFGGVWVGHAQRLRDIWLRIIEPEDVVFIPGDISWALKLEEAKADLAWLDSLPGTKVLLRGNHDLWWSSMKKMRGLFESVLFIQNDAVGFENYVLCGSRGWICPGDPDFTESTDRKIYERELLRMRMTLSAAAACGKPIIAATHFPPMNKDREPSGFTELYREFGVKTAVYGHLHGESAIASAFEGVKDGTDYRLVSLDRLHAAPLRLLSDK